MPWRTAEMRAVPESLRPRPAAAARAQSITSQITLRLSHQSAWPMMGNNSVLLAVGAVVVVAAATVAVAAAVIGAFRNEPQRRRNA